MKYLSSRETLSKFYELTTKVRKFGEPYSRVDMANLIKDDPYVGVYATQAKNAKSWYLADRTHDGPTGINSQMSKYFGDAINAINSGVRPEDSLATLSQGVAQVLAQYGIASRTP